MSRELLIMRHGKPDRDSHPDDLGRVLTARGRRSAERMGCHLARHDLIPDHVVCSPATHALSTAYKICKVMGTSVKRVQVDERIYDAGTHRLFDVLHSIPHHARRPMLIGHNPGLEIMLLMLCAQTPRRPDDGKLLPAASLALLEVSPPWTSLRPGSGVLHSITRPGKLPSRFPYPHPDSREMRDRPAYYYSQSGVIPYRLKNGRLEILIVGSSSNRHFVLPKGIHDPGMTIQESAAKEAREEAGIEGEVGLDAVGRYTYRKWGAPCTVDVFPMFVTRVLPRSLWQEHHRGREWVSPERAMRQLREPALRPLIKSLLKQLRKCA